MLYFYKQHSLVQPEELHLNGDGVYFNIFTEDSRGEDTTGTLKNIGDDTVLYASIQNAGKNRYMQLTGYLDYQEIPLTFYLKNTTLTIFIWKMEKTLLFLLN